MQGDDFGTLPFSITNAAVQKSVQNTWLGHIFLEVGGLNKTALFWLAYPTPLRGSSMTLVPREAQKQPQGRFSCMLIPFPTFLLDSDEGKVKYSSSFDRFY